MTASPTPIRRVPGDAMNDRALKQRFADWAAAYAGAQFQRLGYASTERLAPSAKVDGEYQDGGTGPADEIEAIVRCMEQAGRWREARVLRAEYFMAALPEVERLQRLRRIGLTMSRAGYYVYLGAARAFVLGALIHHRAQAVGEEVARRARDGAAANCV
jgi:hypothetical protein